jgi:DnaK suppressor protein
VNAAHAAVRATLAAQLQDLRTASAHTAEDRRPIELDQTSVGRLSRMDSLQVQAMAQAAERRRFGEIKRVEAAIQRIDADEYGYCLKCGEAIAASRLKIDPTIATCIGCAR